MADALGTAARLVWGAVSGPRLTPDDRALVATGIGGIVLFSRNVVDPAQVRALIAEIRASSPRPVRIAVDQEGGHVVRIAAPLTPFGPPMSLGATRDRRLAYEVARASGRELAALGVDVVLAPVLDVAADLRSLVVGARAFGDDPALVARLGAAMIRGYLDGGVLPVAKHFPGHGRTPADSHLALPVVAGSRAELDAIDLPPFRAAVAAGVPALMTAHVVHTALDDDRPATLSPAAIEMGRSGLGFDGLIVTDALVMDAVARGRPVETAAVEALAAGSDVVIGLEAAWRCIDGLEAAIRVGRIDPARVAEAGGRADAFDRAAARRNRAGPGGAASDPSGAVDTGAHRRLADRLARRSLTVLEPAGYVPVDPDEPILVVDVRSGRLSPVEDERGETGSLAAILAGRLRHATSLRLDPSDGRAWERVLDAARTAGTIVLATRDAFGSRDARLAIASLATERTIRIALRSPADLALPGPGARIAAYADTPPTLEALADALVVGPRAFPGRLPVALATDAPPEEAVA